MRTTSTTSCATTGQASRTWPPSSLHCARTTKRRKALSLLAEDCDGEGSLGPRRAAHAEPVGAFATIPGLLGSTPSVPSLKHRRSLDVDDASVFARLRAIVSLMRSHVAVLLGVLLMACGADEEGSDAQGLTAVQRDGVWLFFHSPTAYNQALLTGRASVAGECLMIADSVVVWHRANQDEADAALTAAMANSSEMFTIGGGGRSLDEGDDPLPPAITERCDARTVWFGSPE